MAIPTMWPRRRLRPARRGVTATGLTAVGGLLVAAWCPGQSFTGTTQWPALGGGVASQPGRRTPLFAEVAVAERPSTELDENPRKSGLALMLDDGTRKSHSMAENTQFVTGFFKGLGDRASFSQLVVTLYFVYEAMEEAFTNTADERVRRLDYPELRRKASIEEDLAFFYGPGWREQIEPSPAANRYCARIREVAADRPELLIAHQYTRYLGDLFGGQMMGGMAENSLGLEAGQGTSFYRFCQIEDTKAFITEWYRELNQLDLSSEVKDAIVDEANLVFRLNIDILEELDGSPFTAAWQLFASWIRSNMGLK